MMKPWNVVILALAAATIALRPITTRATEYADNPNPACHVMRNLMPGVPAPAEPNRADMLTVTQNDQFHNFRKSYFFLLKIDREGTAALAQLPPNTPKIDMVIDMHLRNLVVARSELGDFAEDGRLGAGTLNPSLAVAMYQKAEETTFTDDRGCVHTWLPSFDTRVKLAGMYIYAIGTEQDAAKAKAALMSVDSSTIPIIKAIDQNWLPGVSGISCVGVHNGFNGDTPWHDGKTRLSRTQFWTNCWPVLMQRLHSIAMVCSTS